MKKQLTLIITLLSGLMAPALSAQTVTGTWEVFPGYSTPTNLVETPEYVYVKSSSSLCGYDKSTGEILTLNAANRLNGNQVLNFWYNPKECYLFVAHTDHNINLVFDDGRTINVPDLREATISADKTIQDVAFAGGKAYVATKSGLLVIDAEHGAIVESALWGKDVVAVAVTDSKVILCIDKKLYVGNRQGSFHNFDQSFSPVTTTAVNPNIIDYRCMETVGNDKLLINYSNTLHMASINNQATDNSTAISAAQPIEGGAVTGAAFHQVNKEGLTVGIGNRILYFDATGKNTRTLTVGEANGKIVADWNGTGSGIWLASAAGYGQYSPASSAYSISPVRPAGTTGANVGMLRQLSNGNLVISSMFISNLSDGTVAFGKATKFDVYDSKTINPVKGNPPASIYSMFVNPFNENEVLTSHHNYIAKVTLDGSASAMIFDTAQQPFTGRTGVFSDIAVDSYGNLWVLSGRTIFKGLKGYWENGIKKDGWSYLTLENGFSSGLSSRFLIDTTGGVAIVTGPGVFAAVELPATGSGLTTSTRYFVHSTSTDEDGATLSGGGKWTTLTKDKNGWIWLGSDGATVVITDPRLALQTNYHPKRPKVARNDGTNLADYLLGNIMIYNISVDENNEKWFSTYGSGLYRVNADGTEILNRYSTDNSDIPSDIVYCSHPDRNSNKVYVGTPQGLSVFHSTTAPASSNYDNVYAYPNPVTPDYTGFVTITGLKANSLVKISDSAGNVFYETRSDGGLATWNCCDASGRRVKSGVYFVFASETGEGQNGAAVTKIVIVN